MKPIEYETPTEEDGRLSGEVAEVEVDYCGGEKANPLQRHARHHHRCRGQRGKGRLEIGVGPEVLELMLRKGFEVGSGKF